MAEEQILKLNAELEERVAIRTQQLQKLTRSWKLSATLYRTTCARPYAAYKVMPTCF